VKPDVLVDVYGNRSPGRRARREVPISPPSSKSYRQPGALTTVFDLLGPPGIGGTLTIDTTDGTVTAADLLLAGSSSPFTILTGEEIHDTEIELDFQSVFASSLRFIFSIVAGTALNVVTLPELRKNSRKHRTGPLPPSLTIFGSIRIADALEPSAFNWAVSLSRT